MSAAGPADERAASARHESRRAKVKEVTRGVVSSASDAAKTQARQMFDTQRTRATGEIGRLAGALRQAGESIEGGGISAVLIQRAADSLETFGDSFDGKDLDAVLGDLERFGRRNPAAFLGIAAVIGFTAARFVKSSARTAASGTGSSAAPALPPGGDL